MKNIWTFLALVLLVSCGSKPALRNGAGSHDSKNGENKPSKEEPNGMDDESKDLELIAPTGSKMRMLNAQALTRLYRHVFAEEKYGYQHCAKSGYWIYEYCHDSIFNANERILMGSFDLYLAGIATPNVTPADTLTLNYVRSVRAGLARECQHLVAGEYENLKQGQIQANKLIKASSPKVEDLEEFFRIILGIGGSKIPVDIGAANYVAGFAKSLSEGSDDEIRATYSAVCVAIAMDPAIILY